MARCRVVAPYVTLKVHDRDGAEVVVGYYTDAIVDPVDADQAKSLERRGFIEKVKEPKEAKTKSASSTGSGSDQGNPDTVEAILADVGDDKSKAAAALKAENAKETPRKTLVEKLEAITNA